jgi:hypothetical protein
VLTGDNDKNKIQRIKAFSKTQVHNSIGGFYATIKVNKTSVSRVNSNKVLFVANVQQFYKSWKTKIKWQRSIIQKFKRFDFK